MIFSTALAVLRALCHSYSRNRNWHEHQTLPELCKLGMARNLTLPTCPTEQNQKQSSRVKGWAHKQWGPLPARSLPEEVSFQPGYLQKSHAQYLLLPVALAALTAVSSLLTDPDDNEPIVPLRGLAKSSDPWVMPSAGRKNTQRFWSQGSSLSKGF